MLFTHNFFHIIYITCISFIFFCFPFSLSLAPLAHLTLCEFFFFCLVCGSNSCELFEPNLCATILFYWFTRDKKNFFLGFFFWSHTPTHTHTHTHTPGEGRGLCPQESKPLPLICRLLAICSNATEPKAHLLFFFWVNKKKIFVPKISPVDL